MTLLALIVISNRPLYAGEEIDIELLKQAWTIPGGGSKGRPYYSLDIDGIHFDGERPWEARWSMIKDAMNYRHKKVLELGCNIALTSTYLLKYQQAHSAIGIDRPNIQLERHDNARLMEAAQLTHRAFKVNIPIIQLDMNNSPYEEIIGTNYDVVICMSFLKWIEDKERLLNYLGQFEHIIYEGHDEDTIEIERFAQHGFQHTILGKTHIGTSYPKEQCRTVIYFFKHAS